MTLDHHAPSPCRPVIVLKSSTSPLETWEFESIVEEVSRALFAPGLFVLDGE